MFGKNIKLKSSVEKSSTLVNGRVPPPLANGTKAVDAFFSFLLVEWLSLSALIIHKDVKKLRWA